MDWILSWYVTIGMKPLYTSEYLSNPHWPVTRGLVAWVSDRNLAAFPAGGNVGFVKLEEGCGKSCPEIAESIPALCCVFIGVLGLFSLFARCRVE